METEKSTPPKKIGAPVVLRCPSCTAEVRVSFRTAFATCTCGHYWKWKQAPKGLTL